jgi:hypothetical protein
MAANGARHKVCHPVAVVSEQGLAAKPPVSELLINPKTVDRRGPRFLNARSGGLVASRPDVASAPASAPSARLLACGVEFCAAPAQRKLSYTAREITILDVVALDALRVVVVPGRHRPSRIPRAYCRHDVAPLRFLLSELSHGRRRSRCSVCDADGTVRLGPQANGHRPATAAGKRRPDTRTVLQVQHICVNRYKFSQGAHSRASRSGERLRSSLP